MIGSEHKPKSIILKQLNILKATALATYKDWAAYRSHLAVSIFVGPVTFLVQIFIWNAVYSAENRLDSTLSGLTLNQMLAYFGIATTINYLIYDSADWDLQTLIRTGNFITFMLRPVSHCYFAFCEK